MFHAQLIWNTAFGVFTVPVSENMLFVIIGLEKNAFFFFLYNTEMYFNSAFGLAPFSLTGVKSPIVLLNSVGL